MNHGVLSLLAFEILASICLCEGVRCQFCADSHTNRNPRCVSGGAPEFEIHCDSGKCLKRVRSSWFSVEGPRKGMERSCGRRYDQAGCSTQDFGTSIICICEENGCNSSSFVRFNALLWICIGHTASLNIRLTIFNEF